MPRKPASEKAREQRRLANEKRLKAKEAYEREHVRFTVRYQWRRPDGCRPGADRLDWRSWREFGVVPILFKTRDDAQAYLYQVGFKNLRHLPKASASVERTLI